MNDIKIDIDQINQVELDQKTAKSLEIHGVTNKINAHYLLEIEKAVHSTDITQFIGLHPHFHMENTEAWKRALCAAIAFLRRYKLEYTLESIELEHKHLPNETGFKRGKELDQFFTDIYEKAVFQGKTFEEHLQEFNEINGLSSLEDLQISSSKNSQISSSKNSQISSSKPRQTSNKQNKTSSSVTKRIGHGKLSKKSFQKIICIYQFSNDFFNINHHL